ncbi:arginine exporter ArgO [Pectobacterium versatile]|jgi:L-lysine exporter family protein LysE/ArgO|uniref:Arginine exporter protein ArgO n=1 Tax=Pectobacterium versatile TaxID=2488639 RepID=A0ABU8JVD5_9GAMM|nr:MULTISPECIES: arginine exporter ArgO [Pectobacterium]AZK64310.1 arginine exporter ArgO [Pectobacterium versatile]MBA0163337.1 arginine exporter ArgO [Pectobacterium versatile]MBA0173087.1 arginine exporter ArgO [Pectobacterium versatile]MBA0185985.1 arginine exporter ArgO [Pectobacterium versatile]MBD0845139.1 arginine exporter protein [Pectobacterium carotovorum subsp. carotovorum]
MWAVYLQGVLLGAAMILPLGPQNAFVMNQGIRRQYHLMVALLCALSDMVLIAAGIFGGSALLSQSSLLLGAVTWGGVAFLLWFGWGAMKTAFSKNIALASAEVMKQSRWRIIATMLAVTWLNPHVYLDTFVVLGSLGSQFADDARSWFALGTMTASFTWFFALALLASWLAPWLNTPRVQRVINFFVGVVMWGIGLQLARHGWQ